MSRIPSIVISDESLVSRTIAHSPARVSGMPWGDRVVAEFSGDDRDNNRPALIALGALTRLGSREHSRATIQNTGGF